MSAPGGDGVELAEAVGGGTARPRRRGDVGEDENNVFVAAAPPRRPRSSASCSTWCSRSLCARSASVPTPLEKSGIPLEKFENPFEKSGIPAAAPAVPGPPAAPRAAPSPPSSATASPMRCRSRSRIRSRCFRCSPRVLCRGLGASLQRFSE